MSCLCSVADLRGVAGTCTPPGGPNSFIFMQFSAKKLQNNRLAHPFWELAHPLGKILDPPLLLVIKLIKFKDIFPFLFMNSVVLIICT